MRRHSRVLCCAAIVVALFCAAVLPAAAASPFIFTYTFVNPGINVAGGVLSADGTFTPGTYFSWRQSDGSYYSSGSTVAWIDLSLPLTESLTVSLFQGQQLTASLDDAFRMYCEGSQGQKFVGLVDSVLFRLCDDNNVVLGQAEGKFTLDTSNLNYILVPVPKFTVDKTGTLKRISCIVQLKSTFTGDLRIFFGGRTWTFTLTTPGDPANPDYTKPDGSQLTDYIDREEAVNSNISGGLSSASNIFSDFGSKIQILLGGVGVFSNVISRLLGGVTELNTLVLLSLALGLFALLVGFVATVLRSSRSDAAKPPDKMVWYSDWHTQRKGRRK